MRRWAFYLSVALSAFGIGLLFAGEFHRSESIFQVENEVPPIRGKTGITRVVLPEIEDNEPQMICSGLDNEDFFEPAIDRWLKGKKLSTKPMRPPEEYRSEGDEYTASLVDVNQDGKEELLIEAYCSPIKNCSSFIYEKQGKGYRRLFFSRTGIQTVSFVETSINHYPKIRVRTKLDEKSGFFSTYKLDETYYDYDPNDCAKYKIDKFGKVSTVPVDCDQVDDGGK